MRSIIRREILVKTRSSAFMADFGEALPLDALLWDGSDPVARHNEYPCLWQELVRGALAEHGAEMQSTNRSICPKCPDPDEVVAFFRSGCARSPGVSQLFWAGDQLIDWSASDGLRSALVAVLSGGLSGFTLNHIDVGGYTTVKLPRLAVDYVRTKEEFMRWCELGAFTTVYRTHPGSQPSVDWQFDDDAASLAQWRRMARVHEAWGFLRAELMREAAARGWPVARAMLLHHPDEPDAYALTEQFLLGPDLLVAPVMRRGATTVDVWLPRGCWTNVWTGAEQRTGGGWLRGVAAPVGRPGLFGACGSRVLVRFVANLVAAGVDR
jgi:alpha-glucosidase